MSTILPEIGKGSKRFIPFLNNKILLHHSTKPIPVSYPPTLAKEVHLLR